MQDTYGKSKEDLAILMEGMIEDLCEYSLEDIERAFKEWRRESEKLPTVAALRKLINLYRKSRSPASAGWKPETRWTQVVRERLSDWSGEILAEFSHGDHKSQIVLEQMFAPKHVHIAYRKEGSK
jgi:hypothetical protein